MRSRPTRIIWACLLGGACLLAALAPASAAPVFARKYGFSCTMCHSTFPRLNDFGQRYRGNGYQLPGREDDEQTVLEGPAPFAARTSGGYNYNHFKNTEDAENVNEFQLNGLDLLSGGLIAQDIGYFLIYTPEISGGRGVAAQTGNLEMGNLVFSRVSDLDLTIRVGRFEGAFVPFSAKRTLSFAPYEVYDFAGPGGLALGDTQTGLEVAGGNRNGLRYALGWVDGSGTNQSSDGPSDLYLRVAKVFGQGEGQTAGHRLGVVGYWGKARPEDSSLSDMSRQSFDRIGVDAAANFQSWSINAQYLRGTDDRALWGGSSDYDFTGGFVQALYLPSTQVTGFARFDWVSPPGEVGNDIQRWTVGGRYYFADNLALHVEYSRRTEDDPDDPQAREDMFTTRVDWAF